MQRRLTFAVALLPMIALGADFGSRLAEAKRLQITSAGALYEETLGPFLVGAMRTCVPPGSNDPQNLGAFALVGTVNSAGQLRDVEVRPVTRVSSCFRREFEGSQLPVPPPVADGERYPIAVEMKVEP
jgi:hypothetical protein